MEQNSPQAIQLEKKRSKLKLNFPMLLVEGSVEPRLRGIVLLIDTRLKGSKVSIIHVITVIQKSCQWSIL